MRRDSDHDVLAIYICPRPEYFALTAPRRAVSRSYSYRHSVVEMGAGDAEMEVEVDVCGWEHKHACQLALASNPTLLDALRSPMVYVNLLPCQPGAASNTAPPVSWGERMLSAALRMYDRRALAQSYLAHARKDLREQVRGAKNGVEGPRRKKCAIEHCPQPPEPRAHAPGWIGLVENGSFRPFERSCCVVVQIPQRFPRATLRASTPSWRCSAPLSARRHHQRQDSGYDLAGDQCVGRRRGDSETDGGIDQSARAGVSTTAQPARAAAALQRGGWWWRGR
eukprot:COSAG01_NODE_95_length_26957_cov_48.328617_15_plen_281_part_00